MTHDTPSIGGLVTIAPILFAERLRGTSLDEVQSLCREHLFLTHPDEGLAEVCASYVELLDGLLFRTEEQTAEALLARAAKNSTGLNLPALVEKARSDLDVVGGLFSPACYISGSWPSVLYLAYRYLEDPGQALVANTNLGGDNVHRGAVLGTIVGLVNGYTLDAFFAQLTDRDAIETEITELLMGPEP